MKQIMHVSKRSTIKIYGTSSALFMLFVVQQSKAFPNGPTLGNIKLSLPLTYTTDASLISSKRDIPKESFSNTLVRGIGEAGCSLPSPSKVNTMPERTQTAIFIGVYAALGIGTALFSTLLDTFTMNYEWVQAWRYAWPLLGLVYISTGVSHLTNIRDYVNIFPSQNAWGIWRIPGSPEFHIKWTGVAEILGGLGLIIGGAIDAFAPVWYSSPNILSVAGLESDCAAVLFFLTLAVTPSNIYMFTHGANFPVHNKVEISNSDHALRGVMQIFLLTELYQMSQGTFDSWISLIS